MAELLTLFWIFCKIGLFTIGGGMAMLPLVQQELVKRGLMTMSETVDMVAISQMTPGPFAANCATFVGMRLYGIPGAIAATAGVILPSLVICLIVAKIWRRFNKSPLVKSVLSGLKPVVAALVLSGLVSVAASALFPGGFAFSLAALDIHVLIIAAVLAAAMLKTKVSPVLLILAAGVYGAVFLSY